MSKSLPPIIDGDGHVFEDIAGIYELMADPYKREYGVTAVWLT